MVAVPVIVMFVKLFAVAPLASNTTAKLEGASLTFRFAEGENRQVTPGGRFQQPRVTSPLKLSGVTATVTGSENELLTMLRLAGEGAPSAKVG